MKRKKKSKKEGIVSTWQTIEIGDLCHLQEQEMGDWG